MIKAKIDVMVLGGNLKLDDTKTLKAVKTKLNKMAEGTMGTHTSVCMYLNMTCL